MHKYLFVSLQVGVFIVILHIIIFFLSNFLITNDDVDADADDDNNDVCVSEWVSKWIGDACLLLGHGLTFYGDSTSYAYNIYSCLY